MNAYEIIELIKIQLALAGKDRNNLLYGINIETDPYRELGNCVPFILIEENASILITNQQGYVYEYLHSIELTCAVKAAKEERSEYKKRATALAENTVKEIGKLSDVRFRIFPKEMIPGEVIIGGLKCSAVKIVIEVKTLFM